MPTNQSAGVHAVTLLGTNPNLSSASCIGFVLSHQKSSTVTVFLCFVSPSQHVTTTQAVNHNDTTAEETSFPWGFSRLVSAICSTKQLVVANKYILMIIGLQFVRMDQAADLSILRHPVGEVQLDVQCRNRWLATARYSSCRCIARFSS